jgi:hypothetical protein
MDLLPKKKTKEKTLMLNMEIKIHHKFQTVELSLMSGD